MKPPANPDPYSISVEKVSTPAYLREHLIEHEVRNAALSKKVYAAHAAQALRDGSPTIPWKEPAAKGQPPYYLR